MTTTRLAAIARNNHPLAGALPTFLLPTAPDTTIRGDITVDLDLANYDDTPEFAGFRKALRESGAFAYVADGALTVYGNRTRVWAAILAYCGGDDTAASDIYAAAAKFVWPDPDED